MGDGHRGGIWTLLLSPPWGYFLPQPTAVFLNTEGDGLPNVINFQVPRVGI